METELTAARLAHESMLAAVRLNAPSAETVNQVMIGRTLVARHAIAAVDLAMELAGGAGFYRSAGLERKFRDIQAARYHPLQSGPQAQYAGAMALGLPVDKDFLRRTGRRHRCGERRCEGKASPARDASARDCPPSIATIRK